MPINTVPNQRTVYIHRERAASDFLGIKNANWQAAARDLGAHALLLYLYFACNADGFNLALSPAAIRQTVGMPPQTYRDQFLKLIDKGYLVHKGGNRYDFYEIAQHAPQPQTDAVMDFENDTPTVGAVAAAVQKATAEDREININNTNINKYPMEKQVSPSCEFNF